MNWDNTCNLEKVDSNLSCNNFVNNITSHEFAPFKNVTENEYKLMLVP